MRMSILKKSILEIHLTLFLAPTKSPEWKGIAKGVQKETDQQIGLSSHESPIIPGDGHSPTQSMAPQVGKTDNPRCDWG